MKQSESEGCRSDTNEKEGSVKEKMMNLFVHTSERMASARRWFNNAETNKQKKSSIGRQAKKNSSKRADGDDDQGVLFCFPPPICLEVNHHSIHELAK